MIHLHEATSLRQEAEAIKEEWGHGVEPDARAALLHRPELRADKSIVVDLAYEEYCLRFEAGAPPDVNAFCDRFPTFRQSVRRLVAGHQALAENIERLEAQAAVRWPEVGERLGDLTLQRQLGRGAFARVFLAVEESTGDRPVVVKLSPEGAAEARVMGRLHHPHIVPILSARFEESVGLTVVCMPFLGAATLTDVLDRAFPTPDAKPPYLGQVIHEAAQSAIRASDPVPQAPPSGVSGQREYGLYTEAAACLALQIADALALLHREGVCHRDLKPSNVLLTPNGQALLLDFNLSADAHAALPRLGGTLPYMAPEQLRALIHASDVDSLDGRVDLFALGVILYELLSGQHPFGTLPCGQPTETATILLDRQVKGFPSLRTLNPAVDRRLARLVESCLSFDPAGRPTSAASLAAAFRRYLSLPARLWRGAIRKPLVSAAAAGLLLLAVGGAAGELASQPSADARDYRAGQDAYANGDYGRAEEQFQKALWDFSGDAKPRKYHTARAAALIRLGEANDDRNKFGLANQELSEANTQQSAGATMARIAYCSSRLDQHKLALAWYDRAIDAGYASAGLYNDRGAGNLQLGNFPEAQQDLEKALSLDPTLLPALYNRALNILRNRSSHPNAGPISESTLDGMQRVADFSPPARQVYLDAAQLCALAVQEGRCANPAARASQALYYLRKAVECGQITSRLDKDPVFKAVLGADQGFQDLLNTPPGPLLNHAAPQWLDPVSNSLE